MTHCTSHGGAHEVDRPNAARRGYDRRWARYAKAYLGRPENRFCRCGCGARARIVDHVRAVSGPEDPLFWDPANHQPLTRACHSRKTNRFDGGFGNPARDDAATARLVLLAGPPLAGKTVAARRLNVPVLDWDVWYARVSGLPLYVRGEQEATMRLEVERQFRSAVEGAHRQAKPACVIRGAPERWQRGMYRRLYGAKVVMLLVPAAECLRRLEASGRPADVVAATQRAIHGWWARYEASPSDTLVRWVGTAA